MQVVDAGKRAWLDRPVSQYDSAEFQAKFSSALERMVDLVRARLKGDLIAVVLGGGYGRGFGTVRELEGELTPFNDIDLVAVTGRDVDQEALDDLARSCTAVINKESRYRRFQVSPLDVRVDVDSYCLTDLQRFGPTMYAFDLRNGGRVLYGPDVLQRIPAYTSREIRPLEAMLLLCNRSFSLSECFAQGANLEQASWMYYFSVKAVVDSGAALLILLGRYATSPVERATILRHLAETQGQLPDDIADLVPVLAEYTQRKSCITGRDCEAALDHWGTAREVILRTFRHCVSQVFQVGREEELGAQTEAMVRGWEAERRQGLVGAALARRQVRQALVRIGLAKHHRGQAEHPFVLACAPHLLAGLRPGHGGDGRMVVHQRHLDVVAAHLRRAGVDLERAASDGAGQDEVGVWNVARDVAINAWKSRA